MIGLLREDERRRPDLFIWNGPLERSRIESWLQNIGVAVPNDLIDFWARTGGGDAFESETFLAPFEIDGEANLGIEEVNATQRERGLPRGYLIFHSGLGGFSAVRLDDGKYVQLNEESFQETGAYSSLEAWYRDVLRAEYRSRYDLP
jgi:hypothetical protein